VANSALGTVADILSDEQVKMALTGKGKEHAVEVVDMGLMAAQGKEVPHLVLYMPEVILAIRNESAKQQFTQYQPSEEDKRRSLMIVAHGYVGNTITEGCTSITAHRSAFRSIGWGCSRSLPNSADGGNLAK
jgi:hypothetical protein